MTLPVRFHRYHSVSTILSIPFCPIPFCPYTILSIPFCPYHFVLEPPFSVIDHIFSDFPCLYCVWKNTSTVGMGLSSREKPLFMKKSLVTRFFLSSYFRTHPTLLLKILGERMHRPSSTSNCWVTVPQFPSKSPPMYRGDKMHKKTTKRVDG